MAARRENRDFIISKRPRLGSIAKRRKIEFADYERRLALPKLKRGIGAELRRPVLRKKSELLRHRTTEKYVTDLSIGA